MPSHPDSPHDQSLMHTNRWEWSKLRKRVLIRDGYRCQLHIPGVCTGIAEEVDHIRPRGLPGGGHVDDLANLRSVCKPCHRGRGMAPARPSGPSRVTTRDYT